MKDPKSMSMSELVAAYNKLSGKKAVKKFRTKADGIAKVSALAKSDGKPAAKADKPAAAKSNGRPPKDINLPYAGPGKGEPKSKIRDNTVNAGFVALLRKGTTMAELAKVVVASDKAKGKTAKDDVNTRVRSALRMLHTYNGYGIKQTGDTFRLVTK
jgi:hypothetical protein